MLSRESARTPEGSLRDGGRLRLLARVVGADVGGERQMTTRRAAMVVSIGDGFD
jgi:hypothetical protein